MHWTYHVVAGTANGWQPSDSSYKGSNHGLGSSLRHEQLMGIMIWLHAHMVPCCTLSCIYGLLGCRWFLFVMLLGSARRCQARQW